MSAAISSKSNSLVVWAAVHPDSRYGPTGALLVTTALTSKSYALTR